MTVTVGFLRSLKEPAIAFSWISPRASYWLLRKWGVTIDLQCFDLTTRQTLESLQTLDFFEQENPDINKRRIVNEFRDENLLQRRWYPIVDYDACTGCLECVNYCLFGVYVIDKQDKPKVELPDQCRDGCPACARVCPGGAIMFPEYDDPIISGREPLSKVTDNAWDDELDQLIDDVG